MKKLILGALALFAMSNIGVAEVYAKDVQPEQLELCGAFVRTAPWCDEAIEGDSREIEAFQMYNVSFAVDVPEKWAKLHREKRRGIGFIGVNEEGQKVKAGRPVLHAVARVIAVPPGGTVEDAMLYQALLDPEGKGALILLPAEGDFTGWNMYILSSEGHDAVLINGQLIELGGRHRTDGNILPDFSRLPPSSLPFATLVQRGDGTGLIEALEATFTDHKKVHDSDGSVRIYSGLSRTFTPTAEGEMAMVEMHTNCRKAGQRLEAKANLRLDTANVVGAAATSGLALIPQAFSIMSALVGGSCR